jgi:hypothetical protein
VRPSTAAPVNRVRLRWSSMLRWLFHRLFSERTMNFNLQFHEHDVSVNAEIWTALATTGSDETLASVRAAIQGVLERNGIFTVEDDNDQVVRRIETTAEFEGFMQEIEMQRNQYQQEQS